MTRKRSRKPVCVCGGPYTAQVNQAVSVDGSASHDLNPGGSIVQYDWYWGDGSPMTQGVQAVHTYTAAGVYGIGLTVVDNYGNSASCSTTVTVSASAPTPPPLPGTPASPTPADTATGISLTQQLSWQPASDATAYDVKFGTVNPPTTTVSSGQVGTSFQPSATAYSTAYYWQVIAKNSTGSTSGPVWSFTTQAAPPPPPPTNFTLTVQNGSGSGSYAAGTIVPIVAAPAPTGQQFSTWTGSSAIANPVSASTTITMPAANTTITATYAAIPPPTFSLTVVNGTGTGAYTAGTVVTISANAAPGGQQFAGWTGFTVANPTSSTTTLVMPATAVTVTATYVATPPPTFTLTVVNGTGSGSYGQGTVVSISANAAPAGQVFSKWTGATVANPTAASTTLTMPGSNTTVTATYVAQSFTLTVVNGSGSGTYAVGTVVSINANPAPSGQQFSSWTGATVANPTSASTTLTMPASNATVTANYVAIPPPPTTNYYPNAIQDRVIRTKPALPTIGAAGTIFNDPLFKTPILRATDANTRPGSVGRSYRVPSNAHLNTWNADSTKFYVITNDGTLIPYSFSASTMQASRILPINTGDGGLTLSFYIESQFSQVDPNLIYGAGGSNSLTIRQYNFSTNAYSDLLDLTGVVSGLAGTFVGAVQTGGNPENLITFFGGASQDTHFYLLFAPIGNLTNRKLLNTVNSTLNGNATGITLGFHIHSANIDRSGRYVFIYPTSGDVSAGKKPVYIWDTSTDTFTGVSTLPDGHDSAGFGVSINQSCCAGTEPYDPAQWQYRVLSAPNKTTDLINPVLAVSQTAEVYLADHSSWLNASPTAALPFISSLYRYGAGATDFVTYPWRAWDDEIIAVSTDGSGTVYRFCHHRSNSGSDADPTILNFWSEPIAAISPDGKWVIFTSNMEKTLGTDTTPGNTDPSTFRQDVFVAGLQGGGSTPPPPSGTVTLTANPSSITAGQSSTLTLTMPTTNYHNVMINGIRPTLAVVGTTLVGTLVVTPATTTLYQASATDPSGNPYTMPSVTVTVISGPPPPPSPPGTPSSPAPNSGTTGISVNPTLTWSASGATSYDVYFGTASNPPLVSSNQSLASYTPATLSLSTQYFWKIVAKNSAGNTTGPIWNFTTAASAGGGGDPTGNPLVTQGNLVQLGSFVMPSGILGTLPDGTQFYETDYMNGTIGFNAVNNSLFIVGHDWGQHVGEVSIAPIGGTSALLQGFLDSLYGKEAQTDPDIAAGTERAVVGGLYVAGGKLLVAVHTYYDGNGNAVSSHFSRSKTLTDSNVTGPLTIDSINPGFTGGYFAGIPTEWQSRLGGDTIVGKGGLAIITRTSYGPAAFAVNSNDIIAGLNPVPASALLYYDSNHETLGTWNNTSTVDLLYNMTTTVNGAVIPAGTATILFFGVTGEGIPCYGDGVSDPSLAGTIGADGNPQCYDPANSSKGTHAYPYTGFVWAYNLNDLAAVKAGSKNPWDIVPYASWTLPMWITGAAYDSTNNKLYISSGNVIFVFQVSL